MSAFAEIELKLETDAEGVAALKLHPLLEGVSAKTVDQSTTYFDTSHGALRKTGLSLRVRAADGGYVQTVKQRDSGSAGLFARPEWEQPVAGPTPDLEALRNTPAADVIDGRELQATIRSDTRRGIWALASGDDEIELVIDEGRVAAGDNEEAITEVEIELKAGARAALFGIGRDLARTAPLRIGVLTKAERGQRLADGTAATAAKAEPIALAPNMTVAEGFAAIAHACLRHFRLNESLIVRRRDAAALHQARVAMRRLRSAFSLFRPAIADKGYSALREELRWFTAQLGDARNLDVMLKRLGQGGADASAELKAALESAREDAYDLAIVALNSERLRLLLFDIVAWIEAGKWRERSKARRPLAGFATRALGKRWRKVSERAATLAAADAETRHQLRIEVKKLRYAAEFLAALTTGAKPQARHKSFLRSLEAMQEALGELNDRETMRTTLARLFAGRDHKQLIAATERLGGNQKVEGRSVRDAERAAGRLLAAGPYWH